MNKSTKLVLSIISGIIHHMTMNAVTKMGTLSVYYISYLRQYDPSLTLYYGILMMPISTFSLTLSVGVGAILERKVGSQWTIVISATATMLSLIIMYFFSTSITVGYLVMIMNGLGCGLSFLVTMKNACMYNQAKKGMIAAIVMSFGQIGGPIFLLIGESIINPHSVVIEKDNDYFPIEIGTNFFNYLLFILGLYPVGTLLTLLTFFKYEPEIKLDNIRLIKDNTESSIREEGTTNNNGNKNTNNDNPLIKDNEEVSQRDSSQYKADLRKIFRTKRLYIIASIYFFSALLFFLVMGTFKTIGSLQSFDTNLLKYSLMVAGVFLCIMGPLWGHLYDKLRFKKLLIIINSAGIIIGGLLCLSLMNEWFFAIMVVVNAVFFVGMMSIFNPHVMRVYTINFMMEIAGVMSVASGVSNLIGALFAFCVTLVIKDKDGATFAYRIIFIVGSVFNLISMIIGKFESEDLFEFDEPQKDIKTEDKEEGVLDKKTE